MIKDIKMLIKQQISRILSCPIDLVAVEKPKKGNADLAVPLFSLSKYASKSVIDIYELLITKIDVGYIERFDFAVGFMNIYFNRSSFSTDVIMQVLTQQEQYASHPSNGQTVVIDYSAPNIAKNFSIGHLRSTVIGRALKNLYEKMGYQVVGINHLGDWGTQFGRMIVAYQKWGDASRLAIDPLTELQDLYVRFHEEIVNDKSLEQQGREAFLKLEQNDPKYVKLWQWFRSISLAEFKKMYDLLGVEFDSYAGESFFNDKMDAVVDELIVKNLLVEDEGAMIVRLADLPPALIKKNDGATLYITRDLAALLYRYYTYHFDKILYVVGNEQQLHFKQLKQVSSLMGYDFDIEHINFGLVLVDGKKMSTREGKFAKLIDVIYEAKTKVLAAILEKNPDLKDKDKVALTVGVGAIVFNDLKNERQLNIDFNLDNMLKFEGHTGPYIQYALVRLNSILRNQIVTGTCDYKVFAADDYFELISLIDSYEEVLERSLKTNGVSHIAKYLLALASTFSSFYAKHKMLVDDPVLRSTNLTLIYLLKIIFESGFKILGIVALEEM